MDEMKLMWLFLIIFVKNIILCYYIFKKINIESEIR